MPDKFEKLHKFLAKEEGTTQKIICRVRSLAGQGYTKETSIKLLTKYANLPRYSSKTKKKPCRYKNKSNYINTVAFLEKLSNDQYKYLTQFYKNFNL